MTIIGWKEVYETGILALDNEHRELVAAVNRLFEAVRDKRGDEVLTETLGTLEDYVLKHFQNEERLLEQYKYPDIETHRRAHAELIAAVAEMKERSSSEKETLAKDLLKFLRTWILDHIVEVDKKYGPFLEARAGRFVK